MIFTGNRGYTNTVYFQFSKEQYGSQYHAPSRRHVNRGFVVSALAKFTGMDYKMLSQATVAMAVGLIAAGQSPFAFYVFGQVEQCLSLIINPCNQQSRHYGV
jgi:hypothetical protein